jgi:hypothetical protein
LHSLRGPLLGFIMQNAGEIRTRLGPNLQLFSWLATDDVVTRGMQDTVPLRRSVSGMLSPPARSWSK